MMDGSSLGTGKTWRGAQAVVACALARPGCRVALFSRCPRSGRHMLRLIQAAAEERGVNVTVFHGARTATFPNGSRFQCYDLKETEAQCGLRYHMAWIHGYLRSSGAHRATLEIIQYNLTSWHGKRAGIIETGLLSSLPQMESCSADMVEAAEEFLDYNRAWGTDWSVRDSDACPEELTIRWGLDGRTRARFSVGRICLTWPGEPDGEPVLLTKPECVHKFSQELQEFLWDKAPVRRLPLVAGRNVFETVAAAQSLLEKD